MVGIENCARTIELFLRRREHLVEDRHLVGVQRPFAVVAEGACALAVIAEAVSVTDVQVRSVDHLQPVRATGHEDLVEHVMEVVAGIIRNLHATGEYGHFHACCEVGRAKDDGFQSGARCANLLNIDESTRRFDLCFDADVAHGQTVGDFHLSQQHVGCHDLCGRLHLREHDFIEPLAGTTHHFDDVVGGPLGAPVVHPNAQHLVAPVLRLDGLRHSCA